MSKLYLSGRTDLKKSITARAGQWIDLQLGYDEKDYEKNINVRLNVPEDTHKPTLWIAFGGKVVEKCEVEGNRLACETVLEMIPTGSSRFKEVTGSSRFASFKEVKEHFKR
jgi:hypothetical protein